MEGRGYRDLAAQFARKNTDILGVSFDTVEENAAFARKFDFPYPLLCDTAREIGLAYGACDSAGDKHARRISYIIGADGKVEHAFAEVDPKSHATQVLELL